MKGLSVNSFWTLRPKMPFRYKTQFFTGLGINDAILSFTVTSINLPKMEGQASEGSIYFGNTIYTVPVWNIASRKLEISFEETDEMNVTKFLDALNNKSYGKAPWKITIIINEYDEKFNNELSTAYICHLISYDEPSFKRDGAAQQVTMSATFIVDTIINNWSEGMATYTGQDNQKTNEELNPPLDNLINDVQNEKFTFGDFDAEGGANNSNTKDFNVTNSETDAIYNKMLSEQKAGKLATVPSKEDLKYVHEENAKRMKEAYSKFEEKMKSAGYNISVNDYNDTGHDIGIGTKSGSHLLGQKVDINFTDNNGNKLTPNNMTKQQVEEIAKLAKEAGLTPNWETTGDVKSGWGDFALAEAKSIDKNGKVVDLSTVTWTGETAAKNTSTKAIQEIGA